MEEQELQGDDAPFVGETAPTVAIETDLPRDYDDPSVVVSDGEPVSGYPGVYLVRGSDGGVKHFQGVSLRDLSDHEEFSTVEFGLRALGVVPTTEAFSYGQSQAVPGSDRDRIASRADTSLVRPGAYGLPQGWQGFIFGWRARVSAPAQVMASETFRRWTETVSLRFEYCNRTYANAILADLMLVPRPMQGETMPPLVTALAPGQLSIPVHLRENLNFKVSVDQQSGATARALRRTCLDTTAVDDAHKELFYRLGETEPVLKAITDALTVHPILVRVYLRGWWLRSVV